LPLCRPGPVPEYRPRGGVRLRLVFLGTSDFAVPSLEALAARFLVAGVVTRPDQASGRGQRRLTAPPVKRAALRLSLPLLQVGRGEDGRLLEWVCARRPDLVVVVAYGRILKGSFLAIPEHGCVNVHASLLPRLRGAAPIHRAILEGADRTGVTTMRMNQDLDAGDIIFQRETAIGPDECVGSLHDRLAAMGAELIVETVQGVGRGAAPRIPQDVSLVTWAPPLVAADQMIDWSLPAGGVKDRVRGLDPWPGAQTYFRGRILKVFRITPLAIGAPPGWSGMEPGLLVDQAHPDGPAVTCGGGGAVRLVEVQPAGGVRMEGATFSRGQRLRAGERLGHRVIML
jgi:methionyl-tRNA formyltransferase